MPSSEGRRSQPARPVLVIGKDQALRERLHRVLESPEHAVLTVLTVDDALKLMKHDWPGVVLVDLQRLEAPSHEVVNRLRAVDATLPIIFFKDAQEPPGAVAEQAQAVLPREVADQALITEVRRWLNQSHSTAATRWPGSILVVDNEPKICHILQEFLQSHGFSVITADSGASAIEAVRRSSPSVVLLDIAMPGMDGLTALQQIKHLRPATTVIMVTGLEEEQLMNRALSLGAYDYVLKPFNLDYLETTLLSKVLIGHAP